MKRAGFTLETLFYPETSVKANTAYNREAQDTPSDPQVKIFFAADGAENSFTMGLRLDLEASSPADPYNINLFAVGRFIGDASLTLEEQAKLILQSGPNILYGAARDHVFTLTSKSAWNEFFLPPIVFDPSDFDLDEPAGETS